MRTWHPGIDCHFVRVEGFMENPDADTYAHREFDAYPNWNQGRYMASNEANANRVLQWYRCETHPNTHLQVFRQRAAFDRRYTALMGYSNEMPYIVASYGDEVPWPDHVPEERRRYSPAVYLPRRPRARSTASLWA
jgi:hypothetical protein